MDDSIKVYEQSHIKKLQDERVRIQKKTFTKWVNVHLKRANLEINDLFKDLCDGIKLMKLLEVISDVKLPKPNKGKMRVQKIENVNRALVFIRSKVQIENIGAEDIVDGNERLILGLIWTIILRFQIQELMLEEEVESGEKKSAKDALLLWCQNKTKGYKNVNIKDFHKSWRDGMGFNALIHAHCPELVDYDKIVPENHQPNLAQAFKIAENDLGVPGLLDPEDIDVDRPDDKSVMTYVASLYMTFAKMKTESTGAKRIGKIVSNAKDVSDKIDNYEKLVRDLLLWIQRKIVELDNRDFPNSLTQMQNEMIKFKEYRTVEKPPKFTERASVDEKVFQIILKQKENNMKTYVPPEGLLVKDVESAWNKLEKAEHSREMALRQEILRQEKLEQEAIKFQKKASLREAWLNEMFKILNDMEKKRADKSIEALIKNRELIENDVSTKRERFIKLQELATNLEYNHYHDSEAITKRNDEIQKKWKYLQNLVTNKLSETDNLHILIGLFRNCHTIKLEYEDLEPKINSKENAKHLMAAEDLLERHNLLDSQLKALVERFKKLNYKTNDFLDSHKSKTIPAEQRKNLEDEIKGLDKNLSNLTSNSNNRRDELNKLCDLMRILAELEEEENWLANQIRILSNKDVGQDLPSVLRQIRRHQMYESEIEAHKPKYDKLQKDIKSLIDNSKIPQDSLKKRVNVMINSWETLKEVKENRRLLLKDAHELQKYYVDADDARVWISGCVPLVMNADNGEDVGSAKALKKRHNALLDEIVLFGSHDMERLDKLATLMTKPQEKHNVKPEEIARRESLDPTGDPSGNMMNVEHNMIKIPIHVPIKEMLMARAKHNYTAQDAAKKRDISLVKNETYRIIDKTNSDWWKIESKDGLKGYGPASYLKELPVETSETVQYKWVPIDSDEGRDFLENEQRKSINEVIFQGPTARSAKDLHFDKSNIEKCQLDLNKSYEELLGLAKARELNLVGSSLYHQFMKDCKSFEDWMNEKELQLRQKDSFASDVEGTKKKYEAIIDELAANAGRVTEINDQVNEINQLDPKKESRISKIDSKKLQKIPFPIDKVQVKKRHQDILNKWDKLNKLKCDKEKTLAGASSIDLFNKTAEELEDSIKQKLELLDDDDVGKDKESNEALKRKFQNFLREIGAIKDRMGKFKYLGDGVKNTYPDEAPYVEEKVNKVQKLYDQLQKATKDRNADLNNASNTHKFLNDAKDLDVAMDNLAEAFEIPIVPKDIRAVESYKKQQEPISYEIHTCGDRLDDLKKLGNVVLKERPNDKHVGATLNDLQGKYDGLKKKEQDRLNALDHAYDAQKFYRNCDMLMNKINQQNYKIDLIKPETSIKDVESASKSLDDINATADQLYNRLGELKAIQNELQKKQNPEMDKINNKVKAVENSLAGLKQKIQDKDNGLHNEKEFAEFLDSAADLNEWIDDRAQMVLNDNYKELHNLPRNLEKHRAYEAEITANEPMVKQLNESGKGLIGKGHPKKDQINDILKDINKKWSNLTKDSDDKEKKFKQAEEEHIFEEEVTEMNELYEEMETALKNSQLGEDLPSAKHLLDKHGDLEQKLAAYKAKLEQLKQKAKNMADDDHFNKDKVLEEIKKLQAQCDRIEPRVNDRKNKLQDSLKSHQFAFDVDQELRWIEDHQASAANTDYGRTADEAIKLANKHKKLYNEVTSHKPSIQRLLEKGMKLKKEISAEPPSHHKKIDLRSRELKEEWTKLENATEARRVKLELSTTGQQLMTNLNDIDVWTTEKSYLVDQINRDLDLDQIDNKTAKLNNMLVDLKTYNNMLDDAKKDVADFKMKCQKENILPELTDAVEEKYFAVKDNLDSLSESVAEKQKLLKDMENKMKVSNSLGDIESKIEDIYNSTARDNYGDDLEELEYFKTNWDNKISEKKIVADMLGKANKMADKLIEDKNPFSVEIAAQQESVNKEWMDLLEYAKDKDAKFDAAEEIHRFVQASTDLGDTIELHTAKLPNTTCKDSSSLNLAAKKYAWFEKEVKDINEQLKNLKEDGQKLKKKYPNHGEFIDNTIKELTEEFRKLQNETDIKLQELQDANTFLELMDSVHSLRSFLNELQIEVNMDFTATNVRTATEQFNKATEISNSLKGEEETFKNVVSQSEDIIGQPKCKYINEIQNAIDDLLDAKADVTTNIEKWLTKSVFTVSQHIILKEINQVNSVTALQGARFKSINLESDLEETEKIMINMRNLEEAMVETDKKLPPIQELIEEEKVKKNFTVPTLQKAFDDCKERRSKLTHAFKEFHKELDYYYKWLKFQRDSDEKKFWINDKMNTVKELGTTVNSLEEKISRLQKHNEIEAEIKANTAEMEKYKTTATDLVLQKHPRTKEIQDISKEVLNNWKLLLDASNRQSVALEETRSLLTFFNDIDGVETWLRKKEDLVNADQMGNDLSHCESLQAELNEPVNGKQVDNDRIIEIKKNSETLLKQQKTIPKKEADEVNYRTNDVCKRWSTLKNELDQYARRLDKAHTMHKYYSDLCLLSEQIKDRLKLVRMKDVGDSVASVDKLVRKHDAIVRDIGVIKEKYGVLKSDDSLIEQLSDRHLKNIKLKKEEIEQKLQELDEEAVKRADLLNISQKYQKNKQDCTNVIKGLEQLSKLVSEEQLPDNIAQTKSQIKTIQDRLTEMSAKNLKSKRLIDQSTKLLMEKENIKTKYKLKNDDVVPNEKELENTNQELNQTIINCSQICRQKEIQLNDLLKILEFIEECETEMEWIQDQNNTCTKLINELKNDSKNIIEDVNKTHRSISSFFTTRQKKTINGKLFDNLKKIEEIKSCDNSAARSKYSSLTKEAVKLTENLQKLEQQIKTEREWIDLSQRVSYHLNWCDRKLHVAMDHNYHDRLNLVNKIAKHKDFVKEIKSNEPEIMETIHTGDQLIANKHEASDSIKNLIVELKSVWDKLMEAQSIKEIRLLETQEMVIWSRDVDNFCSWIEEVEAILENSDVGKDLISLQQLKDKINNVTYDINTQQETVTKLTNDAQSMIDKQNYLSDEIKTKKEQFRLLYNNLLECLKNFKRNIVDTEVYYTLRADLDYEIEWLRDKIAIVNKTDLGESISEVAALLNQHQSLENEFQNRKEVFKELEKRANQLEESNHFAHDKIKQHKRELINTVDSLTDACGNRRQLLNDHNNFLIFENDVRDLENRFNEILILLERISPSSDEQKCANQLRKLEDMKMNIDAEEQTLNYLINKSDDLSQDYQQKSKQYIQELQIKLEKTKEILSVKQNIVMDKMKWYKLEREIEEQMQWIKRINHQILIDDYGKDFDGCKNLLWNLEKINQKINQNKVKRDSIDSTVKQLKLEKNSNLTIIEESQKNIQKSYVELKKNYSERKQELEGALEIHRFDQTVVELIEWIKTKTNEIEMSRKLERGSESVASGFTGDKNINEELEEFNRSLDFIKKHEANIGQLERQAEGIKRQIDKIYETADKLRNDYPDSEEHINSKSDHLDDEWKNFNETLSVTKEKLFEAHQYQTWLSQYNDLMKWTEEQNYKILSVTTLPTIVDEADHLVKINQAQKLEIDSKKTQLNSLSKLGESIKEETKFVNVLITEKLAYMHERWNNMCDNLERRREIYAQNLDLRVFFLSIGDLEKWLADNEKKMKSSTHTKFASVQDVEEAIKGHDDFIKYVEEEGKEFEKIKELTKVEASFKKLLENENKQRLLSPEGANVKRSETKKILDDSMRNVDRRKTNNSFNEPKQQSPEDVKQKKVLKKQYSAGQLDLSKIVPQQQPKQKLNIVLEEAEKDDVFVRKPASFSTKKRDKLQRSNSSDGINVNESPIKKIASQMEGDVLKKATKLANGMKAADRKWKHLYGVLSGYRLLMYKDKETYDKYPDRFKNEYYLQNTVISPASEYHKSPLVIQLDYPDQSQTYMKLHTSDQYNLWFAALQTNAKLSVGQELKLVTGVEAPSQQIGAPSGRVSTIDVLAVLDDDFGSISSPGLVEVDSAHADIKTPTIQVNTKAAALQPQPVPRKLVKDKKDDRISSHITRHSYKSIIKEEIISEPITNEDLHSMPIYSNTSNSNLIRHTRGLLRPVSNSGNSLNRSSQNTLLYGSSPISPPPSVSPELVNKLRRSVAYTSYNTTTTDIETKTKSATLEKKDAEKKKPSLFSRFKKNKGKEDEV